MKSLPIKPLASYALVIDARSPREYAEDHIPMAVNLPVVDNDEYALVGIKHKDDKHAAYMTGAVHALNNVATHLGSAHFAALPAKAPVLVYCFRGGKRSKLWGDTLKSIGFDVDVLPGGWRAYRQWVREQLDALPNGLAFKVLSGATGCGKTRLLQALEIQGEQVLDLEALANHRGSLIGSLPGVTQPTQKYFDSLVLERLQCFDPAKPVWVEAESKKVGNVQVPTALHAAMHRSQRLHLRAPMPERVKLCREDYHHFLVDPVAMVNKLDVLRPMVGSEEMDAWHSLAVERRTDELFERIMVKHYDPCYARTTKRSYAQGSPPQEVMLNSLEPAALQAVAAALAAR